MGNEWILINLALCIAGGWTCICRMKLMGSQTKKQIRAQYVIWFVLFFVSGCSWTFGEPATPTQLLLGLGIITHITLGFSVWKNGAPAYATETK